jgi:Flp pilus assembly pilin Flp
MGAASCSALSPDTEDDMRVLDRLLRPNEGQDLLEYAMLASLIAIVALSAVGMLGDHLNRTFWSAIGPSI